MTKKLILFDLLSALMDSWTIWGEVAGSEEDGRKWRFQYLKETYGCGPYRKFEDLVRDSAVKAGYDSAWALELEKKWSTLKGWPEAKEVLQKLGEGYRLGVVTNCSDRLGRMAASQVGVDFEVVVTAESAGYYKPDPHPYALALKLAGIRPEEAVFVAGSAYDMLGTSQVGIETIWHNRIGMKKPDHVPQPRIVIRNLKELPSAIELLERGSEAENQST